MIEIGVHLFVLCYKLTSKTWYQDLRPIQQHRNIYQVLKRPN
jgi:hypothetical protein